MKHVQSAYASSIKIEHKIKGKSINKKKKMVLFCVSTPGPLKLYYIYVPSINIIDYERYKNTNDIIDILL